MRFLIALLFLISAWTLQAQNITFSEPYSEVSLVNLLSDIQKLTNIRFSYVSKDVEEINISLDSGSYVLPDLLDMTLSKHQFEWKFVSEEFVMIKKLDQIEVEILVISAIDQRPLPFAAIQIGDGPQGIITDVNGRAKIKLTDSSVELTATFLGYQSATFVANQNDNVIVLQSSITELQEVVISEYINSGIITNELINNIQLYIQDLEIIPGLSEPDVFLTAQMLPGINSANETVTGINIRGSTVDQTGYLWNEIPIYNPSHYFGNISSLIPSAIGTVDVYKNLVPSRYGGFLGGIFSTTSRPLLGKKIEFESNINLTHADIYVNTPTPGDGSLMLTARRSFNDALLTPTYSSISQKVFEGSSTELFQTAVLEDEFDYNSEILFSDWNAVWSDQITNKDSIRLSFIYSRNRLDFESIDGDAINVTRQRNHGDQLGLGLKLFHDWSKYFSSSLNMVNSRYSIDYSQDNIRNFAGDISQFETRENNLHNLEVRLNNKVQLKSSGNIEIGYQFNALNAGYDISSRDIIGELTIDEFAQRLSNNGKINSLYANYIGNFSNDFSLRVGVRNNFYSFENRSFIEPQLQVRYKLNDAISLKTGAGINSQYLQSFQENNFTTSNNIEQFWILAGTDESREIMKNEQVYLGFILNQKGWLVDIEGYFKSLEGLNARKVNVILDPFFLADENIFGIDLLIKKRFKKVRTWANYSYQDSKANISEEGLRDIPASQNIKHQIQLSGSVHFGQFSFSAGYTFRSGLPYAYAEEPILRTTIEGLEIYEVNYLSINQNRLPDYHRVDCSVWYHYAPFRQNRDFHLDFGISIINLSNRDNYGARTYSIDRTENDEVVLVQRDQFLYGFTPNLSLRLTFL